MSRFLNSYDKFDSNWLGVAVKLFYAFTVIGLNGTFTKKSKPVRDSMVSMVVTVGATLEEFVSKQQRQHRDGIVSVMNTEGKWITARKRSVLLDY